MTERLAEEVQMTERLAEEVLMTERLAEEVLMRERLSVAYICQLSLLRKNLVPHRPKIINLTVLNSK